MTNDIEIISRKEAKERGLKRYFTGKPCKYGHVAERRVHGECCECRSEYRKQNKDKIYRQNKDYLKDYLKEYRKQNKEKIAEREKEYRRKNKNKKARQNKEHRKQNPAPYFLRKSLERMFGNWKGGRKKMEKLHGYTFEQLVARIEFQFKDGMSWENRSEWHIDHRKPISRFLEQGITDPKIVNALSNLQPIWASENLSKGAKFELNLKPQSGLSSYLSISLRESLTACSAFSSIA